MFGLDFMVTDDNKLLLLEVNTNPALSLDNGVLEDLLPVVVDGALDLVLRAQGPDRQPEHTDEALLSSIPGQWQLLLDEGGKYEFSAPEKQQQQQAAATRTEGSADERGGERKEEC
jgi:hypothetical protein